MKKYSYRKRNHDIISSNIITKDCSTYCVLDRFSIMSFPFLRSLPWHIVSADPRGPFRRPNKFLGHLKTATHTEHDIEIQAPKNGEIVFHNDGQWWVHGHRCETTRTQQHNNRTIIKLIASDAGNLLASQREPNTLQTWTFGVELPHRSWGARGTLHAWVAHVFLHSPGQQTSTMANFSWLELLRRQWNGWRKKLVQPRHVYSHTYTHRAYLYNTSASGGLPTSINFQPTFQKTTTILANPCLDCLFSRPRS